MAHPNSQRSGKYAHIRYKGGILGQEPEDVRWDSPAIIRMGTGQVIRGIDEALYDMEIGETRTVTIPPDKAYGDHDPAGVRPYLRSDFPNGYEIGEGYVGSWVNPVSRQKLPCVVTKATKDYLQIDFNHPFAGKMLEYEIELVDITDR